MNICSIIMFHYVREMEHTKYPKIKGRRVSEFKSQLDYMQSRYKFITMNDCINAIYCDMKLPTNAALLTFDDGYLDHYTNVFPILDERKIQGSFFAPVRTITENKVLDVNKIHFILASVASLNDLLADIYKCLDQHRDQYHLNSNDYYFAKLAKASRFDTKEVIFIKRLLQVELDEELRGIITDKLFRKYVTTDEKAFAQELYMSKDQFKCMVRNGMYVGSHGFNHYWLDTLPENKQEEEVNKSLDFLKEIGSDLTAWAMCYPYGSYNDSLVSILKRKNCKLALTTNVQVAELSQESAYKLPRLDTNDIKH